MRRGQFTLLILIILDSIRIYPTSTQYPPASSLEGGGTRSILQRAINCIPARENSHQGGKFGGLQSRLRGRGLTFSRGDRWVISIDCDKVLGSLAPPPSEMIQNNLEGNVTHQNLAGSLEARDGDSVSMSGNESDYFYRSFRGNSSKLTFLRLGVDPDVFDEDDTVSNPNSFVVAAFGDLKPGQ